MRKFLNNRGLTLVEIIITLAVLGIVVSPLMAMFVTSEKINKESEEEYDSIQLAQKYMEEIKGKDILDSSYKDEDGDGVFKPIVSPSHGAYVLDIEISPAAEGEAGTGEEFETLEFQDNLTISADTVITITNNTYNNIKVILDSDNLKVTVENNLDHLVTLYIYSVDGKDYNSSVNVTKGMVKVIKNRAIEAKPDNLLYNINITVKKNADGKVINIIKGTTVFKYKPK